MYDGNLHADYHNILNKWKSYLSQLLKICEVNDVRQTEMLMAELLILPLIFFEVEISVRKSKGYNHQILIELWKNWSLKKGTGYSENC
jgi:hypothetical protein